MFSYAVSCFKPKTNQLPHQVLLREDHRHIKALKGQPSSNLQPYVTATNHHGLYSSSSSKDVRLAGLEDNSDPFNALA
jgi:hypothetical protein